MHHFFTDLLVIGGGLAGLRAANAAAPHQSVLVVTKNALQESNSHYAQGGIAGVLDPEDRFEDHVRDTLTAGGNLCDAAVVDMVVREGPRRIEELVAWGTRFDELQGSLTLGREGGHSHHRIVHALGDATGKEIMRAVIARTATRENIEIWEHAFTLDLLTDSGQCCGAIIQKTGSPPVMVWAKQTILATGGAGQVFRESTNPTVATADGFAVAYRAGAEVRDMEFIQFHPTVLYIAGGARFLMTEAIRGEGAYLVDCNGYRFMPDYDERAELAPRDVVSQSIVRQMAATHAANVYLDLSHLDPALVMQRFPGIAKVCRKFGLDITTDRIPVRPGAHYMVGGVTVDMEGRTSLPGLWAAGEVTSSGLHGANRLASNSLLEGLVYGAHAGEGAAHAAEDMPSEMRAIPLDERAISEKELPGTANEPIDTADVRAAVKSLMGRLVGVERNAEGLREAVDSLDSFCRYALQQRFCDAEGWELQNILIASRLMATAALFREESRGVHFRSDFPQPNNAQWRRHITFQLGQNDGRPQLGPLFSGPLAD
jgi:L-aspartate oxidase